MLGAEGNLKFAAIGSDFFRSVPLHVAKIEDFLSIEGAGTSDTGAETVDQPRELGKRGELQYLQAA
jgi:hypothetical protein